MAGRSSSLIRVPFVALYLTTMQVTTVSATKSAVNPTQLGYSPTPASTTTLSPGGVAANSAGTVAWITDVYGIGGFSDLS